MDNTGLTTAMSPRAVRKKPTTTTKLGWPMVVMLSVVALLITLAGPAGGAPDDETWDPTLPKVVSSGAPGDPVAIANASLQATQFATQTTMELGRKFLSSLGLGGANTGGPSSVAPGN
jgi:hypothetical protein